MTYKLEKNVPIPANASGARHGRTKYPFADMAVGDSFLDPTRPVAHSTIACAAQRTGFKFRSAPEGDGSRVWRAA